MVNICENGKLVINGINCGKQIIIKASNGNPSETIKSNKTDEIKGTSSGPHSSTFDSFTIHSCAIVMASATINGTIFGVVNSFGVLYVYLIEMFKSKEDKIQFLEPLIGNLLFY